MRYLTTEHLVPGMILARTIWGRSGEVLLARGTSLTAGAIAALTRREVRAVWVRDGIADDEDPAELVSDQLRAAAARHVHDVFAAAAQGASPGTIRSAVRRLERVTESLVEEVMSAPVTGELVALKTHDAYTPQHSVEVAVGSVLLGLHIGASRSSLRQLALSTQQIWELHHPAVAGTGGKMQERISAGLVRRSTSTGSQGRPRGSRARRMVGRSGAVRWVRTTVTR
jgi:hypothetical protein